MRQIATSASAAVASTAPALCDVVPWSTDDACTILVLDSLDSDGRFVLYQHAAQVLSSQSATPSTATGGGLRRRRHKIPQRQQRLMWLSGGPSTPKLIRQSLRKIGCAPGAIGSSGGSFSAAGTGSAPSPYDRTDGSQNRSSSLLTIRSLVSELSDFLQPQIKIESSSCSDNEDGDGNNLQFELFVKRMYGQIKQWVGDNGEPAAADSDHDPCPAPTCWIVLDDVSTFASIVGERLAFAFIQSLRSLSVRNGRFGLMIRCLNDHDQQAWKDAEELKDAPSTATGGDIPLWLGAGGRGYQRRYSDDAEIPWERSLVEIADFVVDVCPLLSGASREVHGRLIFTRKPASAIGSSGGDQEAESRGVRKTSSSIRASTLSSSLVVNYCLIDNKVLAIRIQT